MNFLNQNHVCFRANFDNFFIKLIGCANICHKNGNEFEIFSTGARIFKAFQEVAKNILGDTFSSKDIIQLLVTEWFQKSDLAKFISAGSIGIDPSGGAWLHTIGGSEVKRLAILFDASYAGVVQLSDLFESFIVGMHQLFKLL